MKVLAIAVHPDDETLGCGGTLIKRKLGGDSLFWMVLTSAQEPEFNAGHLSLQSDQITKVAQEYSFADVEWLKWPSTRLDRMPFNEQVAGIRKVLGRLNPEVIFMPNRSDIHSDHRIAFRVITSAIKSFNMASMGIRRILACEIPSETDAAPPLAESAFVPNVFVDISKTLEDKVRIMELYGSEVQVYPLPRQASAIRALARYRGASVGVEYAEAFALMWELA